MSRVNAHARASVLVAYVGVGFPQKWVGPCVSAGLLQSVVGVCISGIPTKVWYDLGLLECVP